METRLHSYETFLYKYLLPIGWIPWDGLRSLRRAFPPTDPNSATMFWLVIIMWCITYPLVVFYAVRLRPYLPMKPVCGFVATLPKSKFRSRTWLRSNTTGSLKTTPCSLTGVLYSEIESYLSPGVASSRSAARCQRWTCSGTLLLNTAMPNKSLDRSADSLFRNLID